MLAHFSKFLIVLCCFQTCSNVLAADTTRDFTKLPSSTYDCHWIGDILCVVIHGFGSDDISLKVQDPGLDDEVEDSRKFDLFVDRENHVKVTDCSSRTDATPLHGIAIESMKVEWSGTKSLSLTIRGKYEGIPTTISVRIGEVKTYTKELFGSAYASRSSKMMGTYYNSVERKVSSVQYHIFSGES